MTKNKLIAAGSGRLKKAADSAIDPAVPAELQRGAAPAGRGGLREPSVFAGGRLLTAEDVAGTPEEQLSYVTDRLAEIDTFGRRVDDFVILNKGLLLEVARERELHRVAGHSNFGQWAAGLLDVDQKYVFELLQDAARIRAVSALGEEESRHLTRASARKVVAGIIEKHGVERAREVVRSGMERAAAVGRPRPTAAMLSEAALALEAPRVPHQQGEPDASFSRVGDVASVVSELVGASTALQRAHAALAPKTVASAWREDPEATAAVIAALQSKLTGVAKRLAAAEKATRAAEREGQNF